MHPLASAFLYLWKDPSGHLGEDEGELCWQSPVGLDVFCYIKRNNRRPGKGRRDLIPRFFRILFGLGALVLVVFFGQAGLDRAFDTHKLAQTGRAMEAYLQAKYGQDFVLSDLEYVPEENDPVIPWPTAWEAKTDHVRARFHDPAAPSQSYRIRYNADTQTITDTFQKAAIDDRLTTYLYRDILETMPHVAAFDADPILSYDQGLEAVYDLTAPEPAQALAWAQAHQPSLHTNSPDPTVEIICREEEEAALVPALDQIFLDYFGHPDTQARVHIHRPQEGLSLLRQTMAIHQAPEDHPPARTLIYRHGSRQDAP